MKIQVNKIMDPAFVFGTAFNTAYWHKKYHSGTICKGVSFGTAASDMQGWVFEMQSARPRCMAPSRLHLENPTLHVGPGFYYPEKIPPCLFTFNRISSTGSAVCISKTHLCRSDPDFTILLFYYFTLLLFYYFTILLFYYFTILLFYYFTILLFTILLILREIGSLHLENPPVPVGPRNYRFPDFARNPEKIPPSLFTFNRISSTGSAVCISKTHLCRSDPDFTISFCYYFTNLTGNREFASRKPTCAGCAGWTQKLPLY